jgi:hypothetical protein
MVELQAGDALAVWEDSRLAQLLKLSVVDEGLKS